MIRDLLHKRDRSLLGSRFVDIDCRVVGVFPSIESYVQLTICYLIEYAEDWARERSYIREDKIMGSMDRLHELMAQAANLRELRWPPSCKHQLTRPTSVAAITGTNERSTVSATISP